MISPLTRRVLLVNMLALGALVAGLLYLGEYEDGLVEAELASLHTQAEIFAGALGESAAGEAAGPGQALLPAIARPMLRRLVGPTRARARLFGADGALIADSRDMAGPGAAVQEEALPPPRDEGFFGRLIVASYEWIFDLLPARPRPHDYTERAVQRAGDYAESRAALAGEVRTGLRFDEREEMVLIAAAPVQRFKQVLGALMLSTDGGDIRATVRDVQLGILKVFAVALGVTVILSLYLANAITRPVKLLAEAARRVKGGRDEHLKIPDFTDRRDEIGDLSAALRDMTADLWNRMEAVERFAADVSHEIKNPLTSLSSAVETAARISDPAQQRRLMAIIQEDVRRLDRLITDISSASRLDAELARAEMAGIELGRLLEALVEIHHSAGGAAAHALELALGDGPLLTVGIEGRLVQVFQNLLANAFSFSPPGAPVRIGAAREKGVLVVTIDDCGPGVPEENLDSVFQRFYSQRPESEEFGRHSGLGLAISRQIVDAHRGSIAASNRYDGNGGIAGARFTVRLPAG